MVNFPQPLYVSILFILTTFLTAYLFYKASRNSKIVLLAIITILTLDAISGLSGFFYNTSGFPPRIMLLMAPLFILIIWLFFSKVGKRFINRLDQKTLTLLHVVRIPVEITLYLLFLYKNVPEIMTFAGRNFDIIAGITAPVIFYLGYKNKSLSKGVKLAWNVISLLLLFTIVFHAVFSIPHSFQMFGLDQPNRAVLNFPYVWLPGFIVPIVLFSHLATIRQLLHPEEVSHPHEKHSQPKKKAKKKHKR